MQLYWAQLKGQSLNSYQTTNEKKKNFHNHLVTLYPHHFNRNPKLYTLNKHACANNMNM